MSRNTGFKRCFLGAEGAEFALGLPEIAGVAQSDGGTFSRGRVHWTARFWNVLRGALVLRRREVGCNSRARCAALRCSLPQPRVVEDVVDGCNTGLADFGTSPMSTFSFFTTTFFELRRLGFGSGRALTTAILCGSSGRRRNGAVFLS